MWVFNCMWGWRPSPLLYLRSAILFSYPSSVCVAWKNQSPTRSGCRVGLGRWALHLEDSAAHIDPACVVLSGRSPGLLCSAALSDEPDSSATLFWRLQFCSVFGIRVCESPTLFWYNFLNLGSNLSSNTIGHVTLGKLFNCHEPHVPYR